MSKLSCVLSLAGCLICMGLVSTPASALVTGFVEDFTTLDYCDVVQTTAHWDTSAGEVKLHPFTLTRVGTFDTPGVAEALAIAGNYVYIADGGGSFRVVNVTDPENPVYGGAYGVSGHATGIAVSGNYAYVAALYGGLRLVDISNPASPGPAGGYVTPGDAYGVAVSGDYAYVAAGDSGLQIVDVTNPNILSYAAGYHTSDEALDVAVSGDYAYVADGFAGLHVVDISDPETPVFAGSYDTPSMAWDVTISGDYAYVGDNSAGLQVIDISDPTNPTLAGAYDPSYGFAVSVAISGDYAYVADMGTLDAIDISNPAMPVPAGECDLPGSSKDVVISGDYAFVADGNAGLQVIRIGHRVNPVIVSGYSTNGEARGLAVSGNYAYVGFGTPGLLVLDISLPSSPAFAGSCRTSGSNHGVAISGDYAFIADYGDGFSSVDISDPTDPTLVANFETPGAAIDMAISGDYVFVADQAAGLTVVDISNPAIPSFAGGFATTSSARDVTISGDFAYVAAGYLEVVDVSNPTGPTAAGFYDTPGSATGVAVDGDYAYVADYSSGFTVLDISDPTNPAFVTSHPTSGWARDVEISGDYAYVTDSYPGVLVFDISDPTAPALAGSCDTPGLAEAIVLHGDYAYVADHDGDLRIIEIFQREYGADSNVARSLAFFESDDSILQARLEATCSDSILWEMSADSGGTWQEIAPGSGYQVLTSPGTDLVWRSTHTYVSGGVNPLCSGLSIDWLYTFPFIASVTDIPGDQGHQVSLSWTRSGYDVVGSAAPITQYAVYRRIDYAATRASGSVEAVSLASSARGHGEDITPGVLYPPGDWHFVTTVPARTEDEYAVVVPTLEDSTVSDGMQYTAFFVSALTATPGVYFDSPVDSGYSVDNLAPAPPLNLAMPSATGLEWDECPEEDFDYFTVYGSAAPAMDHTAVLIGYTVGTAHDVSGDVYDYYHVTATDFSGNEGDASSVDNTYADVETEHELPIAFALRGNHPNPFASETRIAFELPEACSVTLEVFDTEGRVVKVLSEREWAGGRHSVVWAGENESGASASPGVYFIRMRAGRFEATRKMMLMK